MKILMLADVFFPDTIGGAGKVSYHLGLELSQKGHEVHILTRNTGRKLLSHERLKRNLYVHRFSSPQKESPYLFFSELKNSYSLAKKISHRVKFDIICIHQSMVAVGPLLSGCLKKIPIICYFHSPWHEEYLIKKLKPSKIDKAVARIMRWIEKRILFKASKIIVLSHFMQNKVLEIHNPQQRILIIPAGVDLDHFHLLDGNKTTAKQRSKLPRDKTIFLTVRNLVPRMGLENLIKAFDKSETLKEKGLLYIGGSGFLGYRLKRMVDILNLNNSIRFLGHIHDENLPGIYQATDFFTLTTEKLEGFGLVILEAMACGTPVLGTPVGAIPEVIGLFDERLIFKGTDWKSIKEKLEDVIENPDGYKYEPRACREFVKERFSWRKVADEFEKEAIGLIKG